MERVQGYGRRAHRNLFVPSAPAYHKIFAPTPARPGGSHFPFLAPIWGAYRSFLRDFSSAFVCPPRQYHPRILSTPLLIDPDQARAMIRDLRTEVYGDLSFSWWILPRAPCYSQILSSLDLALIGNGFRANLSNSVPLSRLGRNSLLRAIPPLIPSPPPFAVR